MIQSQFFNNNQLIIIIGCALLITTVVSLIHHKVARITRWWNPKWAALIFSVLLGGFSQLRSIPVLEPAHLPVIMGNILVIYFSATGLNAVVGTPVIVFETLNHKETRAIELEHKERKKSEAKGESKVEIIRPPFRSKAETWRTRWFT